ncbi:MAG TPA: EAL domain-containing protein [Candidatus Limnocylindrales bacterium]
MSSGRATSVPAMVSDHVVLSDRVGYLTGLRLTIATVTLFVWRLGAVSTGPTAAPIPPTTLGYLAITAALALLGTRRKSTSFATLTVSLLLDGVYLAAAMYATGGTTSPLWFLVYLHLVAVTLLASYRTGLKIALWDTLLLFVVLYAQAAALVAPIDARPGQDVPLDGAPALTITAFWLFALATSLFSALNERELRLRRGDLEGIVRVGAMLDDEGDPGVQARIVLDSLAKHYGFTRGLVLAVSGGTLMQLAQHGVAMAPGPLAIDPLIERAWAARRPLALRTLHADRDPVLAGLLPHARDVIVVPMLVDGGPVGALVLERPSSRLGGVERRVIDVVAQVGGTAALNLRNAVLLRHVRDLAERDALTGAANRRSFQDNLEVVVAQTASDRNRVAAVLFIDLDDFKIVNDTLGHAAGDALLVAVTERISSLVRSDDLVARLGGDEFAILLTDHADLHRAKVMADRLVRELQAPYEIAGHPVRISGSIGVASARDAVEGAADMVRNADVAMYLAKAGGKAGFAVFDPGMHQVVRERHELALELDQATALEQLVLHYQPIMNLATGRLAGVEALVRWRHPERGLVAPGEFIELAEEHGSILPIGRWVLREACKQLAAWTADGVGGHDTFMGVNVSAREIQAPGFVDGVREALADHAVNPSRLIIELTETALLRATPATISTLEDLRAIGVRVVIDDFGTGYFSLSHLRQFPVDALKIAAEFTQEGEEEAAASRTSALAAAIVAMARSLGIETVAEGIETAAQAERMRGLACTYGQGFFFAKPLLPGELDEAIRRAAMPVARASAAPRQRLGKAQGQRKAPARAAFNPGIAVSV